MKENNEENAMVSFIEMRKKLFELYPEIHFALFEDQFPMSKAKSEKMINDINEMMPKIKWGKGLSSKKE